MATTRVLVRLAARRVERGAKIKRQGRELALDFSLWALSATLWLSRLR